MTEEAFFTCPYCWERISMVVDLSVGQQSYIEDCEVCCRPIQLDIKARKGKLVKIEAQQSV